MTTSLDDSVNLATEHDRPFIEDIDHLALLDGQRYVVLRVTGAVAAGYEKLRASLNERSREIPLSHPARPHVTLAGVAAGTPVEDLLGLVREWAAVVPPLRMESARVRVFPRPAQVVVLEIRKTPALHHAMRSLRRSIREHGLVDLARVPPSDRVFHASLCYCSALDEAAWNEIARWAPELSVLPASTIAVEAEVIVYERRTERCAGRIRLAGSAGPAS